MNVLVACEESQEVCKAFRARGHNAYSCDIQECSGGHPEWHIKGDVLKVLNPDWIPDYEGNPCADGICFSTMDGEWHEFVGNWDLIIAHPPCTKVSNAGARWLFAGGELNQERYREGLEAKEFFMKIWNANCKRVVIENPVPSKIFDFPEPTQVIQPYQFNPDGVHPYTKKTLLWERGVDPLVPSTPDAVPTGPYCPSGTSRKIKAKYGAAKRGDDRKNRAKTFPGIAEAMAEQWG